MACLITLSMGVVGVVGVACSDPGPLDGDCTVRVGFEGVTYRAHNELNQQAQTGTSLGEGDLLDCDLSVVGQTEVFTVVDVEPSLALAHGQRGRLTVYVAEGLAKSDWPKPLQSD